MKHIAVLALICCLCMNVINSEDGLLSRAIHRVFATDKLGKALKSTLLPFYVPIQHSASNQDYSTVFFEHINIWIGILF